MIRMILKSNGLASVSETLFMSRFHFLLPDLLRSQNSIPAAVRFLDGSTIRQMPIQPAEASCNELKEAARRVLKG